MHRSLAVCVPVLATLGLAACEPPDKPVPAADAETGDGEDEDEGEDDLGESSSSTTHTFVPDVADGVHGCDPWAQDCPEGEKCVPYGSTGGNWDANKCVPVVGDGEIGDSCTWDGTSAATDSCGQGSHCWDVAEVDGELVGVCTAFCAGNADDPICAQGSSCVIANEGSITLCIATCDPLLQECGEGLGCFWTNNDFNCVFTAGEIAEAEPCGYINDCAPGLLCTSSAVLPSCDGTDCCTAYCDLSDPSCPVAGTECTSFFDEGTAPPTYEDIGVCILPG